MNKALVTFLLCVVFAVAAVAYPSWSNVFYQDFDGVAVGANNTGTEFNVIEAFDVSFVGATSNTFSSDAGTTYYVSGAWKTSSADPGKTTVVVSGGTGTVTSAAATTGTYSVIVFGAP